MHRTPKELIQLYWEEVWNKGNSELIREICADPIVRYDVDSASSALSHDEQVARVTKQRSQVKPYFTHEVLLADDEHVVSVWNMVSELGEAYNCCGIELFRAERGRLVSCWNAPYAKGRWGRDGDPAVSARTGAPELLSDADAATANWLQNVFKSAGVDAPRIASVYEVKPVGHGTTAQTFRLKIAYNASEGNAPKSVILKLQAADPVVQRNMSEQGIYAREVAAYRFFPAQSAFGCPRAYFSEAGAGGAFNIVMEDLDDWTPGDQIAGCSVKEAEAVVRECAALHLYRWRDPDLSKLDWPLRHAAIAQPFSQRYAEGAVIMRANYAAELGQDIDVIDQVAPLVEPFWGRPLDISTLIHGDPRVDNILFKQDGDRVHACLLDFQVMGVGDPSFDLAYFLSGSVSTGDRRAHEKRFVEQHAAAISAAGYSYDAAKAWDSYRAHSIVGLAATVVAAAVIGRNAHIDRLLVALARRNCAAVRDLDGVAQARRLIGKR